VHILLDESLPRPLGLALVGHDVSTVRDESWTSLTNGALLRQASARFDALLTADQNIELEPDVLEALTTLKPKTWFVLVPGRAPAHRAGVRVIEDGRLAAEGEVAGWQRSIGCSCLPQRRPVNPGETSKRHSKLECQPSLRDQADADAPVGHALPALSSDPTADEST
jgi:hypothetical protein